MGVHSRLGAHRNVSSRRKLGHCGSFRRRRNPAGRVAGGHTSSGSREPLRARLGGVFRRGATGAVARIDWHRCCRPALLRCRGRGGDAPCRPLSHDVAPGRCREGPTASSGAGPRPALSVSRLQPIGRCRDPSPRPPSPWGRQWSRQSGGAVPIPPPSPARRALVCTANQRRTRVLVARRPSRWAAEHHHRCCPDSARPRSHRCRWSQPMGGRPIASR